MKVLRSPLYIWKVFEQMPLKMCENDENDQKMYLWLPPRKTEFCLIYFRNKICVSGGGESNTILSIVTWPKRFFGKHSYGLVIWLKVYRQIMDKL